MNLILNGVKNINTMTIYKSKTDNKYYILSIICPEYYNFWLECAEYSLRGKRMLTDWGYVPKHKHEDFIPVYSV